MTSIFTSTFTVTFMVFTYESSWPRAVKGSFIDNPALLPERIRYLGCRLRTIRDACLSGLPDGQLRPLLDTALRVLQGHHLQQLARLHTEFCGLGAVIIAKPLPPPSSSPVCSLRVLVRRDRSIGSNRPALRCSRETG